MATSHLVVLFVVTAGQNGENLGSDEEQIVLFVYLLFDVANNKVVTLQQHYVRPTTDDISETVMTEECKAQTGLPEDFIKNAQPLEHVLDEFDRFLCAKEIHPDHGGRPFCLITDGPLHLRLCIHPEASNKTMPLPHYMYRYFNLRNEFKKFYKTNTINCIKDMLDFLGLEGDQSVDYGIWQVQEMTSIIQRLLNDGHQFVDSEIIKDKLEPGICAKTDYVDDDTVIRARGLPWQSSDQDIARFFRGLNVAKGGVALCLSQQGRRNGEALIRFENKESRDLALRKHKHHLGQRYIEVYKATGKDFVNVAGGNSTEAQVFLSRHNGHGGQVIVRMRGLPYTCTAEQVIEFFRSGDNPVDVLDGEDGILFVHQADGRATGDAFVLFATEEEANRGLAKHRECIGSRYIELFKSTTAEVQQVLNRSMDPRNPAELEPQLPPLIPQLPQTPLVFPQQIITSGTQRDCIRLRGLPYEATVTDILTFLGEHSRNIVFQGVHMVYNAQGTPSGEAFIQMDSEVSAEQAALNKHKKFMFIGNKKRYIEVLQSSGEDMNLVLTNGVNGLPTPAAQSAVISAQQPQFTQLAAMHRPLISPGGTMFPPTSAASAYSGLYPYGQASQHAQMVLAAQQQAHHAAQVQAAAQMQSPTIPLGHTPSMPALPGLSAAGAGTQLVPHGMTHLGLHQPRPATTASAAQYGPYGHQPILYWYPSPPVSPQSAYYVQSCPSTVVMKGLPVTAQVAEIMQFFEGIYEMTPDIQIQRGPDGRSCGEAYVTFATRVEAERAITERNQKLIGQRYIELFMA